MINISEKQLSTLSEHFDVNDFVLKDDLDGLLDKLDDIITDVGFDENYELNKRGLELQQIYDQIYNQN